MSVGYRDNPIETRIANGHPHRPVEDTGRKMTIEKKRTGWMHKNWRKQVRAEHKKTKKVKTQPNKVWSVKGKRKFMLSSTEETL